MASETLRHMSSAIVNFFTRIRERVAEVWRNSGLLTQFLFLIVLILYGSAQITSYMSREIAARSMVDSSLEVEQALARSILMPLLGESPLSGELDPEIKMRIDRALGANIDDGYINLIKLWGMDGELIYSSEEDAPEGHAMEPHVMRVYDGETVVQVLDKDNPQNASDMWIGDYVYEVYMPMYNMAGELIVVAEIYCSVELLVTRIEQMVGEIDRVRTIVIVVGIILLSLLIFFAQRRLTRQEHDLLDAFDEQEALLRNNAELLVESEGLRRALADENDRFLNHIGAELHDGPIQLLSLSALYQSQTPTEPKGIGNERKAHELVSQALSDLRNISVGLILPELEGASLLETVRMAIEAFEDESGIEVPRRLEGDEVFADKPLQVVAYRTVYESLNNAKRHADAKGIFVAAKVTANRFEVEVRNISTEASGANNGDKFDADPNRAGISLGIIGMAKRSRSVGGQLSVGQSDGLFRVSLSLPLRVPKLKPLAGTGIPGRRSGSGGVA